MNPIHSGLRMTVIGILLSAGPLAAFILIAAAELTGWWVLGAFVAGELLVYKVFAVTVWRRTRDLALLRCLGARRSQVFAGVLTEAAGIGAVATAVGLSAVLLVFELRGWAFVAFAASVGVGGALLAAAVPAFRASRVPPGNGRV